MLNQALQYLKSGYSVVASRRDDKRPVHNWTEFQKRQPTEDEVKKWFEADPNANIGFITGTISGFFVLDIEASVNFDSFRKEYPIPPTALAKTGGGGLHFYFKCGETLKFLTKARIFGTDSKYAVDIRGEGGFVVAAPSIHPKTKKRYEWVLDLGHLSDPPKWLKEWAISNQPWKEIGAKAWEEAKDGASAGNRNVSMTSYAGLLMKKLPVDTWDTAIVASMKAQNAKNNPPLSESELKTIYNSIKRKELARRQAEGVVDEKIPEQPPVNPISLKDLYEKQFPANQWTIEELVPLNSLTALSSPPGYYKTWVLLEMATKLARGELIFGNFKSEKCPVLIVNEENWEGLMQARLKFLISSEQASLNGVYFLNQTGIKIKTLEGVIRFCEEKGIKFVVFDSITRLHDFDENKASEIKQVFEHLKKFTLKGISVMFTHHHRKQGMFKPANPSEQMRGSTDLAAMVDTHLVLDKKLVTNEEMEEEVVLIISQPKQRVKENLPDFKVKIVKNGDDKLEFVYDGPYDAATEKSAKINEYTKPILEYIEQNEGCDKKQLIKVFLGKIGSRYVGQVINKLKEGMDISVKGRPQKFYRALESESILEQGTFPDGNDVEETGEMVVEPDN